MNTHCRIQRLALPALLAMSVVAGPAYAVVISHSGNTTDALTFQRPVEDLSALSVIGTAAHFDAFSFVATSSESYLFLTTGVFDTFVILYGDSFSPLAPLSRALVANDDASNAAFNVSGFSWNLTSGRSYTYVVTGFDNDEYGSFRTTIESVAAPVPEPSTWLLLAAGLGLMAGAKRRSYEPPQSARRNQ